jgi:hypothetical protein
MKVGDRVQITERNQVEGYQSCDKGVTRAGESADPVRRFTNDVRLGQADAVKSAPLGSVNLPATMSRGGDMRTSAGRVVTRCAARVAGRIAKV